MIVAIVSDQWVFDKMWGKPMEGGGGCDDGVVFA